MVSEAPERVFGKIWVSGAKKLVNRGKNWSLNARLFKKIEVGSLKLEKGLKRWVSGAKMLPEKGCLEGGTSPYHLLM